MFEWVATIEGIRPISKKKSRRNFRNRSLLSVAFEKFHAQAMPELLRPRPAQPYTGDVTLTIHV